MPASTPPPREHPDAGLCDNMKMCLLVQLQLSGDNQTSEKGLQGKRSWHAHLHAALACCHLSPARRSSPTGRLGLSRIELQPC